MRVVTISASMRTIGPEAIFGSRLNLCRKMGIEEPMRAAIIIVIKMEVPITREAMGPAAHKRDTSPTAKAEVILIRTNNFSSTKRYARIEREERAERAS